MRVAAHRHSRQLTKEHRGFLLRGYVLPHHFGLEDFDRVRRIPNTCMEEALAQEKALRKLGMNIGLIGSVVCVGNHQEYRAALGYLFDKRIYGWWNLVSELRAERVASKQEIKAALHAFSRGDRK